MELLRDEGGCELNQDGLQTETNHQQFLVQQLRLKYFPNLFIKAKNTQNDTKLKTKQFSQLPLSQTKILFHLLPISDEVLR